MLFSNAAFAQRGPTCDQDDPFDRNDCLIMRYINDREGWGSDHERRLQVLLNSEYADIDRLTDISCLDNWGGENRTYLSCALGANYNAVSILLENGSDPNARGERGTAVGYFLYAYYLTDSNNPRVPASEFIALEEELLRYGLNPNQIDFLQDQGRQQPLHFYYLGLCSADGLFWDRRFEHWRGRVRDGTYDLSLTSREGRTVNSILQEVIEKGPKPGRTDLARCEGMIQLGP